MQLIKVSISYLTVYYYLFSHVTKASSLQNVVLRDKDRPQWTNGDIFILSMYFVPEIK